MKKIIVEVPEDWHSKIKARCALKRISIKDWVFEAIIKLTREEDEEEIKKSRKL